MFHSQSPSKAEESNHADRIINETASLICIFLAGGGKRMRREGTREKIDLVHLLRKKLFDLHIYVEKW